MPKLYAMVGLPGSGKSAYAGTIGAEVVSIGDIRKKLNDQGITDETVVYNKYYDKIKAIISCGSDCVVDASNVKEKSRRYLINNVVGSFNDVYKICIIIATPYNICCKNFSGEMKHVKEAYESWYTPGYWEGWDEIWIHYDRSEWMTSNGDPTDLTFFLDQYNQESKHHTASLGRHLSMTFHHVYNHYLHVGEKDTDISVAVASLLHDCGKPYTKSYDDDLRVHYYYHHNVGGYETLFFACEKYNADTLYVSNLVCHHMDPYFWNGDEKAERKFIKRYGTEFYDDVMILHNADVYAH